MGNTESSTEGHTECAFKPHLKESYQNLCLHEQESRAVSHGDDCFCQGFLGDPLLQREIQEDYGMRVLEGDTRHCSSCSIPCRFQSDDKIRASAQRVNHFKESCQRRGKLQSKDWSISKEQQPDSNVKQFIFAPDVYWEDTLDHTAQNEAQALTKQAWLRWK
jgi:hypothetical protein